MRHVRTAKLFMNGRSQAVRLPQEYRFEGEEVFIYRDGDRVVLSKKPVSWEDFFASSARPSADFMADRRQPASQEREPL